VQAVQASYHDLPSLPGAFTGADGRVAVMPDFIDTRMPR
jgi:hypothetical protein